MNSVETIQRFIKLGLLPLSKDINGEPKLNLTNKKFLILNLVRMLGITGYLYLSFIDLSNNDLSMKSGNEFNELERLLNYLPPVQFLFFESVIQDLNRRLVVQRPGSNLLNSVPGISFTFRIVGYVGGFVLPALTAITGQRLGPNSFRGQSPRLQNFGSSRNSLNLNKVQS